MSYQIQGAAIEVRKQYGPGHKEILYQKAFAEALEGRKIHYEREKTVNIYSFRTDKALETIRPDFVVDNKVIVEVKALPIVPKKMVDQLFDYLRNSEYELGYFINFCGPRLLMRRVIYTNDRKHSSNNIRGI